MPENLDSTELYIHIYILFFSYMDIFMIKFNL